MLSGRTELNGFPKLEVAASFLLLVVKSVVQGKTLPSPGRASCHFLNCPPSRKALKVAKNIERFLVLTCFSIKTFCVNSITFPQMGCVHSQAFLGSSPLCISLSIWSFVCLFYILQDGEIAFSFKAHCMLAVSVQLLIEACT